MVISHSLFGTAVVLIVRSRYASMGRALEHASADLGAGTWRRCDRSPCRPSCRRSWPAGCWRSRSPSDDVVGSQFTSGAGNQTWPLRILSALRFGLKSDINATATMMLGATILALLAAGGCSSGWRRAGGRATRA